MSARSYFNIILSIPVYGILYFLTAISVLAALFFALINNEFFVRKVVSIWANTLFFVMGKKLNIIGASHIQKGKRYILLVNHCSLFDIPAVLAFYPGVSWFGREYLLKIPLFGRLLKVTDYVSMKEAGITNTKKMLSNLVENSGKHTIAMFPEGTRTTTGQMNRFKKGFIYLMRAVNLDILPVTLNGLYQLKPKTHFYIDFSAKLHVVIHESIPVEDLIDKDDNEIIAIVKARIEAGVITN
ncbi:MAG TPA: 1-acyl-sn-glycerol-3-phosphate acyltransferase [Caldithrix sp.]|nr:1-acyl-sn-glycerol-3-phosphate acyltransferase [Calditrichaceae bacterium]HEM49339.1 1-acyl-sn-glycerol-3-phosphate acyltransferase [Caldithrix sp.]